MSTEEPDRQDTAEESTNISREPTATKPQKTKPNLEESMQTLSTTSSTVLENPVLVQRTIDEMSGENDAQNDDESPTQRYWRHVFRICAVLDPIAHQKDLSDMAITGRNKHRSVQGSTKVIYVVSLTHSDRRTTAGAVCKCPPLVAAECLMKTTHRLANEEQIAAHDLEHKNRFDTAKRLRDSEKSAAEQIAGALTAALSSRPNKSAA